MNATPGWITYIILSPQLKCLSAHVKWCVTVTGLRENKLTLRQNVFAFCDMALQGMLQGMLQVIP